MGRPKKFDRGELLDQAIQVFWKKGFADTSIQDLEKATGVNKSGLYAEFKDKQDLYLAGLQRYIASSGVTELLSRAPLGWANIEALFRMGQSCKGQKGCFVVNSAREVAILPAKARALMNHHVASVKALLIENLHAAHPEKDLEEVEALANLVLTFNSGLGLQRYQGGAPSSEGIDLFLRLLKR